MKDLGAKASRIIVKSGCNCCFDARYIRRLKWKSGMLTIKNLRRSKE